MSEASAESPQHSNLGIPVVPPRVHGSPSDLPAPPLDALSLEFVTFDGDVPFWRPGVTDILRGIGWFWLLLFPALALVVLIPASPLIFWRGGLLAQSIGWTYKLWILAVGVVITIVVRSVRRGVQVRKDLFCIHCGYSLDGLAESGSCPECGRPYLLSVAREYKKDPGFFVTRYKASRKVPEHTVFAAGTGPTPGDGTR
ncbi:MAG: hypothetical protein AMXMBFR58_16390 [Phycisphaerae bacterium]